MCRHAKRQIANRFQTNLAFPVQAIRRSFKRKIRRLASAVDAAQTVAKKDFKLFWLALCSYALGVFTGAHFFHAARHYAASSGFALPVLTFGYAVVLAALLLL